VPKLYSTFPGRAPAVGLLLLRVSVASVVIVQGTHCLSPLTGPGFGMPLAGLLAVLSGVLLLVGFLTPIASLLTILFGTGFSFSWLPPLSADECSSKILGFAIMIVAVAIVFLGPGSVSLDSRVFGRRKVIIPRAHVQSDKSHG